MLERASSLSSPPAPDTVPDRKQEPALPALGERLFGLDLRSLAVLRIGLGLVLISDLFIRATDLEAHYTGAGVLPAESLTRSWSSSIHLLNDTVAWQTAWFAIAGLCAIALILGYRTRLATILSCFLLISLHGRNHLVVHGGDVLLRVLLFWSMFLPLGACWSLDRRRSAEQLPSPGYLSLASAAYILQLCFVYWFSVAHKSDPIWWREGSALYYVVRLDNFTTRWGQALLLWPDEVLRIATFATLGLEALGPLLLFVPFRTGPIRTLVIAAFVGFHVLGLGLTLELGNFPYVCAVAWLALLPTWFWDKLRAWQSRGARPAGPPLALPNWAKVLVVLALIYVLLWNLRTLDPPRLSRIFPPAVNSVGQAFGIDQMWDLFAPYPMKHDGWYVAVGQLKDGTEVDVFQDGRPVTWDKPELVSATYRNERWRKYLMNLLNDENAAQRQRFAEYLYRDWNARHTGEKRAIRVKVYYMLEITLPNYERATPQRLLMATFPAAEQVPQAKPGER